MAAFPPPAKKARLNPEEDGVSGLKKSRFLNSLTLVQSVALFRTLVPVEKRTHMTTEKERKLKTCFSDTSRDGEWWMDWVTCEICTLKADKNGGRSGGHQSHPRLKITIPKGVKDNVGYRKAMEAIGSEHASAFNELCYTHKNSTSQTYLFPHHLAYNAFRGDPRYREMKIGTPGHQISHRCDRTGCVTEGHLEYVESQAENNKRQKCVGMVLVIDEFDVIIKEMACVHAGRSGIVGGGLDSSQLENCCRRLYIVCLGNRWPELG